MNGEIEGKTHDSTYPRSNMPLLFSYGTLRDEAVQMSLFGRRLASQSDHLLAYVQSPMVVNDPQPAVTTGTADHTILTPSAVADAKVAGTALEVTEAELDITDQYEPVEYRRVIAMPATGRHTWVYVDAGSL
jgi:hypothetical protein